MSYPGATPTGTFYKFIVASSCGRFFVLINLKKQTIESLKKILEKDYKIYMSETEANELGVSLLRLSKLALIGLARAKEREIKNNKK